jgi:predicted outer membrane repeat protein
MIQIKNNDKIFKITLFLVGIGLICLFGTNITAAANPSNIYVNTHGNDSWNGLSSTHTGGLNGPKVTIKNATGTVKSNGNVYIAQGTYKENNITINTNMTIIGENQKDTLINGQQSENSIFILNPGIKLLLTNLTITNGTAVNGGAIYNNEGELTITNITFTQNRATGFGGAIHNDYGTLTVTNSRFTGNSADMGGGAISNSNYSTLTLTNTTFTNNIAGMGGAIYISYASLNMHFNRLIGNSASSGSAIYNSNGVVNVDNSTFTNNAVTSGSSGTILNNGGTLIVNFCWIVGNSAPDIYSISGNVNAEDNWWGSNFPRTNPKDANRINVPVTHWIVLTVKANPEIINKGDSSVITANLLYDNDGNSVKYEVPNVYINFNGSLGTLNPISTTFTNGMASAIFKSNSAGFAIINAIVDGATFPCTITVNSPPTVTATPQGGFYNTPRTVTLTTNHMGNIYYTTNGTYPDPSSQVYTGPITITSTTTLKYLAIDIDGNISPIYTETYIIDTKHPTASATPKGGLYNSSKVVKITMSEAGKIYYTLNGTTPTSKDILYTKPITITSTTILKYMAMDLAGNQSPIYSQLYTVDKTAPKVSSTNPKNNKSNVSRTSNVVIKFTKNIKSSTNYSKITLKNLKTGKKVTVKLSIKNNTLTIKPNRALSAKTSYQLTIPKTAVKDYAGNNLLANYILKYKTGA